MNGSDHRAVILHCDVESHLGMGPPRAPHDDVKLRIKAVTSAMERGELSDTAQAYTDEITAMTGESSGETASRKDSTAGKRIWGP